jgi:HEAT repeat protein
MGRSRDAQAVPALKVALKDLVSTIRGLAAVALGMIGPPDAVEALCAALDDSDGEVQRQAAGALGLIGDPAALPALRAKSTWRSFVFVEEGRLRAACQEAIEAIERKAGSKLVLPRPAQEPEPSKETLPRPAGEK